MKLFGKQYSFVLFDFDGTIVHSLPVWLDIYKTVFAKHELYPTHERIVEIAFYHNHRIEELGITDTDMFWKEIKETSAMRLVDAPLFDGIEKAILSLKQDRIKTGIFTGSIRRAVDNVLQKHGLAYLFDVIVAGDDVTKRKPDPEGVERACAYVGLPPRDSLFIGDSIVDHDTSMNAHMDFAFYANPLNVPYILPEDLTTMTKLNAMCFSNYHDLISP